MITMLRLQNFKKFRNLDLPLRSLTLLTGCNSGGKSTAIQALLLTQTDPFGDGYLPLNHSGGLELGEASDVLYANADSQEVRISLETESLGGEFVLEVPDDRSTSLTVIRWSVPEDTASYGPEERVFVYLCAERLGPRDLQEVAGEELSATVGFRGQHVAQVLSQLDRMPIPENLRHPNTDYLGGVVTLLAQTEYWMSTIVKPIQLQASWLSNTNAAMVRFREPNLSSDWIRPANVGFGISYSLPVVVAALTTHERGMLVIENPEAHLHPAGQSAMGRFLARVASTGRQVVIETHSDHFVNGVRRAIAEERTLDPSEVAIHYFADGPSPVTLELSASGSISNWPAGFFDQIEEDLGALARAKGSHG